MRPSGVVLPVRPDYRRARTLRAALLLLVCLSALLAFSPAARAQDAVQAISDAADVDRLEGAVPSGVTDIVGSLSPTEGDLDAQIENTVRSVTGQLGSLISEGIKSMTLIVLIVILCAIAAPMQENAHAKFDVVHLAGTLGIAVVSFGHVGELLDLGRKTIQELDGFSKALLPTLAAGAAAAGTPASAAAKCAATLMFSDILITLITRTLIPMVFAYVAVITAGAAIGDETLERVSKFIKWIVMILLTVSLSAFMAYLTISGTVAGAGDALAVKGLKMAVSTAVPVVGGIISDAADTVLAGASVLKSSLGLFGLFAVLGICIVPFLRVGIEYLFYKLMAALISPLASDRMVRFVEGLSTAFGLILGMVGSVSLLLLISIITTIRGVGVT